MGLGSSDLFLFAVCKDMLIRNQPSWRSAAYLKFIRGRPCVITGRNDEMVVAHHVRCLGGGGTGLKPPDWLCVPLVEDLHRELHQHGEKSFWEKYQEDPLDLVCMNMLVYLAQKPSERLAVFLSEILRS